MKLEHKKHELRSLEIHRLINRELQKTPERVIQHGLANLSRWKANGVECHDFQIWQELLETQPNRLSEVLESTEESAIRLRQSSPFPGLISEETRKAILLKYP